jgi:hypothetical protein
LLWAIFFNDPVFALSIERMKSMLLDLIGVMNLHVCIQGLAENGIIYDNYCFKSIEKMYFDINTYAYNYA